MKANKVAYLEKKLIMKEKLFIQMLEKYKQKFFMFEK